MPYQTKLTRDKRFVDFVRNKVEEVITFIDENKDNLPTLNEPIAKMPLDGKLFYILHVMMDDMREGAENFSNLGKVGTAMYFGTKPSRKWSDVLELRDKLREEVARNHQKKVH